MTIRQTARIFQRILPVLTVVAALSNCGRGASPHAAGSFEARMVDVAALISGRILSIAAEEGELVTEGDTLVVLDTELIALRRAESVSSRKSLQAQRRAAESEKAQAERQAELVGITLSRVDRLRQEGSATGQRVDELKAERDIARSRIQAAAARLAALDADLIRQDAALAVLDRQLEEGIILAPISGTVLLRAADPGEVASPGRGLLRLADLSRLELRIFLEEEDLDRVSQGMELKVLVDAMPEEPVKGRVSWISDEAEFTPKNAQTRKMRAQLVYAVRLVVDNPRNRLHPGMPAEVVLP